MKLISMLMIASACIVPGSMLSTSSSLKFKQSMTLAFQTYNDQTSYIHAISQHYFAYGHRFLSCVFVM